MDRRAFDLNFLGRNLARENTFLGPILVLYFLFYKIEKCSQHNSTIYKFQAPKKLDTASQFFKKVVTLD